MTATEPDRARRLSWWIRVAIVAAGLYVLMFATFVWVGAQAFYYQQVAAPRLQAELGFDHSTPYIRDGLLPLEVFALHPEDDGPLARAGVAPGDIVVSHGVTTFYRDLATARGGVVTFTVVDGGEGPHPRERDARSVELFVPE